MLLAGALLVFLAVVITAYLWTLNSRYSYFRKCGIPTPPYCFFFGHYKTLWSVPHLTRQLQIWTRQFGSIYGLFEGTRPLYIVSDVEFLREVFIKQFSSFNSRRLPFSLHESKGNKADLFAATGATWHRQRHVLNPTFSSAKLKLLKPLVNECIEAFMKKLSENCEEEQEVNIYVLYKRLTMDVICHCAFGINTDMQNDLNNEYMQKFEQTVAQNLEKIPLIQLSNLMPWLTPLIKYVMISLIALMRLAHKWFPQIEEMPRSWLLRHLQQVVDMRILSCTKQDDKQRIDLLQLMLDATIGNQVKDDTDSTLMSKELHYDEVISNIFIFMIAGYDTTTAAALAYCTYVLAREPHIQEKLQAEIDLDQENADGEYDRVHNLLYIDMFVREVLRMFPIASQVISRECNTTTTVCGRTIEKGSVIQPDMYTIHYDPKLWGPEDPNLFVPERHSMPRHPVAFIPFGVGSRSCIGLRFALMEIKLALTRLLLQYSVLPGEQMEENFQIKDTEFVRRPESLCIKLQKRS